MKNIFNEKEIHAAFLVALLLKGGFALLEITGGLLAYFVNTQALLQKVAELTEGELSENPSDAIANYFFHFSQNFSLGTQHFVALYLLGHGTIKILLITGLLKDKYWCYPLAIVVFVGFIFYQLYRFTFTLSPWLVLISILDALIVSLIWHEYKRSPLSAR